MDLLMLLVVVISTAFFGIIPPGLVGYWAYRQGEKGRQMAIDARDLAVSKAEAIEAKLNTFVMPVIPPFPLDEMQAKQAEADAFMRSYLDGLQKQIKKLSEADIKLAPEDIAEIAKTLSLSLRGAAGAEKQKVAKEMTEQYLSTLTPEQVEDLENAQFRKKFRDGILKFLPGSDE